MTEHRSSPHGSEHKKQTQYPLDQAAAKTCRRHRVKLWDAVAFDQTAGRTKLSVVSYRSSRQAPTLSPPFLTLPCQLPPSLPL